MTINKAIVIVLAVIALGLFTVAGSVIYATQQIPEQPTSVKTQFENETLANCLNPRINSGLGEDNYFSPPYQTEAGCLYLLARNARPRS